MLLNNLQFLEIFNKSQKICTAGLAKDDKLGVRHNFCCRGPIFNPRPDMKTRGKTEGGN